jgi:hypothetical protein
MGSLDMSVAGLSAIVVHRDCRIPNHACLLPRACFGACCRLSAPAVSERNLTLGLGSSASFLSVNPCRWREEMVQSGPRSYDSCETRYAAFLSTQRGAPLMQMSIPLDALRRIQEQGADSSLGHWVTQTPEVRSRRRSGIMRCCFFGF